jgi:hypothetical protein
MNRSQIENAILTTPLYDDALTSQQQVASRLRGIGFEIALEFIISNRGDGRQGRIDLCGRNLLGNTILVEIDRKTPRAKSIYKLSAEEADFKLVVCRLPLSVTWVD